MKRVVILQDDETNNHSQYLDDLGMCNDPYKYLCRSLTFEESQHRKKILSSPRVFTFERFGLFTVDSKLDDYICKMDGIMIILNHMKFTQQTMDRIIEVIRLVPYKPVLFAFETFHSSELETIEPLFRNLTKNGSRRLIWLGDDNGKEWFRKVLSELPSSSSSKDVNESSRTMSIGKMVEQFVKMTLPLNIWDHYGRLRMVHYSLVTKGYEDSVNPFGWLCTHWKQYKTSVGHENLWHYTMTRFWTEYLYAYMKKAPETFNVVKFDDFYNMYPELQDGKLTKKYYSNDVLFSPVARTTWIPPHLQMI
jgi:hypothetical protein